MKLIEDLKSDVAKLRAQLESKSPGCTQHIPAAINTLDGILDERAALIAVKDGLGSQQATQARGAAVLASYQRPLTSTTTSSALPPDWATMTKTQRARLITGLDRQIAGMHWDAEALGELRATRKACIASLSAPKAKAEPKATPAEAAKGLTLTQRCLQAKGLDINTPIDITGAGESGAVSDSEIFDE